MVRPAVTRGVDVDPQADLLFSFRNRMITARGVAASRVADRQRALVPESSQRLLDVPVDGAIDEQDLAGFQLGDAASSAARPAAGR